MILESHNQTSLSNEPVSISLSSDNWKDLELLVNVWTDYDKNIVVSKRVFQENDWEDILNMVYVGSDDFYWTEETKWRNFISWNSDAVKFLYPTKTQLASA